MKNVFFALAFMLVGMFAFANTKYIEEKVPQGYDFTASQVNAEEFVFISDTSRIVFSSCTITAGTQIVSNGEVIYQELSTLHIDGFTCEEFFSMIMNAFK